MYIYKILQNNVINNILFTMFLGVQNNVINNLFYHNFFTMFLDIQNISFFTMFIEEHIHKMSTNQISLFRKSL